MLGKKHKIGTNLIPTHRLHPLTRPLISLTLFSSVTSLTVTRTGSSRHRQSKNGEQPPRTALHDITNDSPIVGLAAGGLGHVGLPRASAVGKTRARPRPTPRSREALLCGQVKTLLQKVDEEVVMPVRIHALLGVSRSPAQLLSPTPANTLQLGVESTAAAWGEPVLPDGIKMAMSCVLLEEETLPKLQPAERGRRLQIYYVDADSDIDSDSSNDEEETIEDTKAILHVCSFSECTTEKGGFRRVYKSDTPNDSRTTYMCYLGRHGPCSGVTKKLFEPSMNGSGDGIATDCFAVAVWRSRSAVLTVGNTSSNGIPRGRRRARKLEIIPGLEIGNNCGSVDNWEFASVVSGRV